MVTCPVGAGGIGGTLVPCSGRTYPRFTRIAGPLSTWNTVNASYAGLASTTRSRASTCRSCR
ncbi:Uncharacterised protein [Mycobacteroides abscessus subsp. abscessus]|nr:Uncharacterised protein [Mycobacteroides abscessus subsp. abscessus]